MARYTLNDEHGNTIVGFEIEGKDLWSDDLEAGDEQAIFASNLADAVEESIAVVWGARHLEALRPMRLRAAIAELDAAVERDIATYGTQEPPLQAP